MTTQHPKVFITGATGFVGLALATALLAKGYALRALVRDMSERLPGAVEQVVGELGRPVDLAAAQVVIHAAARVHAMQDKTADPLAAFRAVNVDGTLALARQAIAAGVRRFIFVSSIKVNGEGTAPGKPYTAHDAPAPVDPYGISKLEAEQGLKALAHASGMELVIIRPVLVYGPGVKANLRSMMNWLHKGIPLPLGRVANKRSLVALDNLVDLIVTCIEHPAAANQTFLVSDGEDLSTTQLLARMGKALHRPARLVPVPVALLELGGNLLGRQAMINRLCGSLQVDISHTRETLGWAPPVCVNDALQKTAEHFLCTD